MTKEKAEELNEFAKKCFLYDDVLTRTKNAWARLYVEAERPIPEKLRSDFYDELTNSDESYKTALENSINYFGVRWQK